MNTPLYVTTAIPYVNAAPHLGFALEMVLADAVARHARARGTPVRFVTGTDDHSLKNVRAAEAAGLPVRAFVDAHAARFRALRETLDLSFDDFVQTSADPRHARAVRALWEACARAGALEKRAYRGLYCVGCEQFFEPGELEGGACPEHGDGLEVVEEENWFFRLSRYQGVVEDALDRGRLRVEPRERAREVRSFVAGGLRDVSVSRSQARARGWGLAVPGDPGQVVYVWLDALAYYLSALGWPETTDQVARYWSGPRRCVHAIGKGITRFHAVLWPALLAAAGLPLPDVVWSHGYVTVGGQKLGKSRGDVIAPSALVDRWGVDAVRYVLLRHVGPRQDADVDDARFAAIYDADLANALGNLVARAVTLLARAEGARVPDAAAPGIDAVGEALASQARALAGAVDDALERLAPDDALRAIWKLVDAANRHLAQTAPWVLAKERARASTAGEAARADLRLRAVLHHAAAALVEIGRALAPFLPETSARILDALAAPRAPAPVLFPKAGRSR